MPQRPSSQALRLTMLALFAALPACQPAKPAATGKIPVTTANDEARTLFMKGRDLGEQLRNTEARDLYVQAVAKDSTFALANLSLAPRRPPKLPHLWPRQTPPPPGDRLSA